jgi:hydroxymethylpyrimidine pyrophosphatase-like HAD family hydrolase
MSIDNLSESQLTYTRFRTPFESIPSIHPEQMSRVREYFMSRAKKGIIIIDLDRNLTDESYELSDPEIFDLISQAKDKGYLVCLNSSRSPKKLRYWQEKLKTHFPTFAENGLILDIPDPEAGLNMQIVTDDRALLFNDNFRQYAIPELREALKDSYPNLEIRMCADEEPEDAIRKAVASGSWKETKDEYGIFINGWTRVKTVMNAFRKSAGGTQYDEIFTKKVLSILEKLRERIPYNREVRFKSYSDDCSILAYPTEQNKTYIWRMLLSYLGEDAKNLKFYHMGDGNEDDIHDEKVTVLAPANAKQAILNRPKERTKIAPEGYTYTKGVIFHLKEIIGGRYE